MRVPHLRELRRVYGFDEVAIAPGSITINPELTNTDFSVDGITLSTPVLGGAMDAVLVSQLCRGDGQARRNGRNQHGGRPQPVR